MEVEFSIPLVMCELLVAPRELGRAWVGRTALAASTGSAAAAARAAPLARKVRRDAPAPEAFLCVIVVDPLC